MPSSSRLRLSYFVFALLAIIALGDGALYVRNMRAKGLSGTPSSYVKVRAAGGTMYKTSIVKGNNPAWSTALKLSAKLNDQLTLQLWKTNSAVDSLLGSCSRKVQKGLHRGQTCQLSKGGTLQFDYEFK